MHRFSVSRKGRTGGQYPQSAVHMVAARGTAPSVPLAATMCMAIHMVAARLGCKRGKVGTGWANS